MRFASTAVREVRVPAQGSAAAIWGGRIDTVAGRMAEAGGKHAEARLESAESGTLG